MGRADSNMLKLPALSLRVADKQVVKASGSLHSPGPHLSFKGTVTLGIRNREEGGKEGCLLHFH